ncbi:MAG: PDZ domain-containing protein [Desulfobacterales bacterium]|nr:PDZ domain-containing protein [Desulfobacterales bacterium]
MRGSLEGIGATLREDEGYIKVESIIPGGPAYRQGQLEPGDIILRVAEKGGDPVDITDMARATPSDTSAARKAAK